MPPNTAPPTPPPVALPPRPAGPPCGAPPPPAAGATPPARHPRVALLALGFRPFFLVAGASAVLSLLVWLGMLHGALPLNLTLPGPAWHAHELLFGYGLAVVAGFLLTAVRNWTGQPTAAGAELAGLVALWLGARAAPWLALPPWAAALLAAALPLALAASLWRPLWWGPNPANRLFLGILAGMALAAAWSALRAAGVVPAAWLDPHRMMLDLLLLTLLVASGRVLPFFTRAALPAARPRTSAWLERRLFVAAGVWLAADLLAPWPALAGGAAAPFAALLAVRVAGWFDRRALGVPILGVLYAGAAWLVVGLLLRALAGFGLLPPNLAVHALTVGAVGVFTLGMMVRITLGHTGRPMRASALMVGAFVAVNLAALTRVFGPLLAPEFYGFWTSLSGALWMGAFGAFLFEIGPMLLRPRVDGRPI